MKVIEHNWSWAKPLTRRSGAPPYIVLHHQAGTGTTAGIHAHHRKLGWSGIGYHYHVRLNGEVHRGRPEWAIGSHAPGGNNGIGICFEGNYETRTTMPATQLESGRELLAALRKKYLRAKVRGHKWFVSTACPGRYFPLDEMLKAKPKGDDVAGLTKKRALLKQRMLYYAIKHGLSLTDVAGKMSIVASDGTPSNGWGEPAGKLAWRVSGHLKGVAQTSKPTTQLLRALK